MRTLLWILVVIILIFIGFSIFQNQTPKEADITGPVKIGVLLPLTGDAAIYGEPMRNVVQLAADEINKAGGINGQPLELIFEDAKCSGKDAVSAMQKLVNVDKVEVVLGGFCSSESLSAVPIAELEKVFLLSGGSSSPDLTGISKYFARNYPSDSTQGTILADIAYQDKGWREVAFIMEQLDYPLGIYNSFSSRFEELGGEVTKEEFPAEATDFRTILTKIKALDADAVFVDTQTASSAARIFKQMSELDFQPALLLSDAISGDIPTVGEHKAILEGALAAEFGIDEDNPKFQNLIASYRTTYNVEEVPYQSYSQTVYDAVYMIADAVGEVGYDGEKIAGWFAKVKNWEGASGSITLKNGDPVAGHVPKVIKDGKVELYEKS